MSLRRMNMIANQMDLNGKHDALQHETHGGRRFAAGLAFGTVVGSALALFVERKMENWMDSGKVADAEDVMNRTGARARRIGDTARQTFRSVGVRLSRGTNAIKHDINKGADAIKHDINKGAEDIRDTMQS